MTDPQPSSWQIHQAITIFLKITLIIGAGLALYQGRIQVAVETLLILIITFLPLAIGRRFQVKIPPEFELLANIFLYAAIFLGEVHNYYVRFWWWDLVLHGGAGFLLGIFGFLLVYVLNEKDNIHVDLNPVFMALFAFTFAIAFGVLWEVFEFTMDQLFDLNMQKATVTDPSGLGDTMWDLIVNGVCALIISMLGYSYLRNNANDSFLENWINAFIRKNPGLFRKQH